MLVAVYVEGEGGGGGQGEHTDKGTVANGPKLGRVLQRVMASD